MAFPLQFPIQFPLGKRGWTESVRLLVEDPDNGNLYYPTVISFNVTEQHPMTRVPTAKIQINTSAQYSSNLYFSPLRNDHIVRLQVNVKRLGDADVWQDIFEGRIVETSGNLSDRETTTTLMCRGHEEEILYKPVTADYTASSQTTGQILSSLMDSYLTRLSEGIVDTTDSSVITDFNVDKDQKYMIDVINRLEELEKYEYKFSVSTTYNSNGTLASTQANWQPVPTEASSKLRIIEGTDRLISADIGSNIHDLYNNVIVYGSSGTPQKRGSSSVAWSGHDYNDRYLIETDRGLNTDNLCNEIATQLRDEYDDPFVTSGRIQIKGTPDVHAADLVYTKIPSIYVNGTAVNTNYRIRRVVHRFNSNGYFNDLDVGTLYQMPGDMLAGLAVENRQNNQNFIE